METFEKGMKVAKLSRKPFKSGLRINTVRGITSNPHTGLAALFFEEDNSVVEQHQCKIVKISNSGTHSSIG